MFKKYKVVLLQTDEVSDIFLKHNGQLEFNTLHPIHDIMSLGWKYQNIHILSDDKIKENTNTFSEGLNGDWYFNSIYKAIARCGDITLYDFKIVATTDLSLGLPKLSQSFIDKYIEEYNKGNIFVEIMIESDFTLGNEEDENQNLIPVEELKTNSDNTINTKEVKESYNREEILQIVYQFASTYAHHHTMEELQKFTTTAKWINDNLQ
jgi:hypothetical protein